MSRLLCLVAAVLALLLPGAELIGSGSGSGGSGSGSGIPPTVTLSDVAALTQQQRNNIVYVHFTGITAQEFIDMAAQSFRRLIANIYNSEITRTSGSQASISPNDVTILDSPTMMMNGDIRELVVGFVIGGKSGQGSPISSAHLEEIIQREGPNLARDMSAATGLNIGFSRVMAATQSEPALSQTVIIGIVIGVVVAIILVALLMVALAVYSFVKTIRKRRQAKAAGSYVEVPAEEGNSFSSNWTPMKVNAKGDYTAVPNSFNGRDTNTAL